MKKFLLLLSILVLHGCVSEPPKSNEDVSSTVSTNSQPQMEGYNNLFGNLWITADYKLDNRQVKVYKTSTDEDLFYNNLLAYLSDKNITANLSEETADNYTERVIAFDETKINTALSNKTGALSAVYYTPDGNKADSLFNIFNNLSKTESFQTATQSEVNPQSVEAVKAYMKLFKTPYDYKFVTTSVSSALAKEIQLKGKEIELKYGKNSEAGGQLDELYTSETFGFDAISLVPSLDGIALMDEEVSLGETKQLNVIHSPSLTFICRDGKIIYSYVKGLYTPTNSEENIMIEADKVIDAIKKRYEDIQMSEATFIESVAVKYAPISKVDSSELYKDYELQPLIEVRVRRGEVKSRFFISPITYTEVI